MIESGSMMSSQEKKSKEFVQGYTDFDWLCAQATDKKTSDVIDLIEQDETAFYASGAVSKGSEPLELRFKQGIFHVTRATGHSIAHIFVQIFKNREHMLASGFSARDDQIIVDIGANEGYYAMNIARHNPHAKIFSFEPNPIAYDLLRKNIESNGLANVHTAQFAVWDSTGKAFLNILPEVTSIGAMTIEDSSYLARAEKRVLKVPVDTITLSDIIDRYELPRIDLLKIDVEGGELRILRDSLASLEIVDRIVIEYHSQAIRHELEALLDTVGYALDLHVPDRDSFGDLYFTKRRVKQKTLSRFLRTLSRLKVA